MKFIVCLFALLLFAGCLGSEETGNVPPITPGVSVPENSSFVKEIRLINDTLEMDNETGEYVTNESMDDGDPSWSPDGKSIVFSSKKTGSWNIWTMDGDGNSKTQLTFGDASEFIRPAFKPDGRKIAFEKHEYAKLPHGTVIASYGIWIMDGDGKNMEELVRCSEYCMSPSWSPDGRKIAYALGGDIWTIDLNENVSSQLTNGTAVDLYPSWSPDGKLIAYSSTESGDAKIWITDGDGNNKRQLTTAVSVMDISPSWSPDGKWIAFSSHGDIFAVRSDGTGQRGLKESLFIFDGHPSWSPDGTKIVFDSERAGSRDIWVLILKQ